MALVTLGYLQNFPAIAAASEDLLNQLIDAASAAINDFVGYTLEAQTGIVEYLSGNGFPDIPLKHRPVNAITEVRFDSFGYYGQAAGRFDSATILTAGTDYVLVCDQGSSVSKSGLLRRIGGAGTGAGGWPMWQGQGYLTRVPRKPLWPIGDGNLKVTYNAGFATIPGAIQQACAELVQWLALNTGNGGNQVVSESLGKYSVGFGNVALATAAGNALAAAGELGTTRQLLARYREMTL